MLSSCADNWLRAVHVLVVVSEVLLLHVQVAVDDGIKASVEASARHTKQDDTGRARRIFLLGLALG